MPVLARPLVRYHLLQPRIVVGVQPRLIVVDEHRRRDVGRQGPEGTRRRASGASRGLGCAMILVRRSARSAASNQVAADCQCLIIHLSRCRSAYSTGDLSENGISARFLPVWKLIKQGAKLQESASFRRRRQIMQSTKLGQVALGYNCPRPNFASRESSHARYSFS